MALILRLDTFAEALLATAGMFSIAGVVALIYWVLRRGIPTQRSGESTEPYIGGEAESVVSRIDVSAQNLYWGFVEGVARGIYRFLREFMHSGKLNEWAGYMAGYYGLLLIVAIASLALYIARLG